MSNAWDERRKAQEEAYFKEQNEAALARLKERNESGEGKPRLSPVTGEPMEQVVYLGVAIDKCPTSGGIWLDAGELEQILEGVQKQESAEEKDGFLDSLIHSRVRHRCCRLLRKRRISDLTRNCTHWIFLSNFLESSPKH